jgi:hypothetical protein
MDVYEAHAPRIHPFFDCFVKVILLGPIRPLWIGPNDLILILIV